jgi:hypothetical protein
VLRGFADVTADDLFAALRLLGMPSAFLDDDRESPDDRDVPMLLGSLQASLEMLAVSRQAMSDQSGAWTAGYLQTVGVRSPCEQQQAFDLLTVRLQGSELLLRGLRKDTPVLRLVRACLGAASRFAAAASTAGIVLSGRGDPSSPELIAVADEQLAGGHAALTAAGDAYREMWDERHDPGPAAGRAEPGPAAGG